MNTEENDTAWWATVVSKNKMEILRYSNHTWPEILRSIADEMECNNNLSNRLNTNPDECKGGSN